MTPQQKLESFLVGGLTGLAVVGIYLLIRGFSPSADAGDWLSFSGSLFGTGLAIAGAVFVEHYRRRLEREEEHTLLRAALARIVEGSNVIAGDGLPEGLNVEGHRGFYLDALSKISSGVGIITYAKERLNIALRNPDLFSALQRVELHIKLSEQDRLAEERILSGRQITEAILEVTRDKLMFEVGALGYCADQAVRRIDARQ